MSVGEPRTGILGSEFRQPSRLGATSKVALVWFTVPPMDDLESAWAELHEAPPLGWVVGRPTFDERRCEWSLYAFDAMERPKAGHRSREWTAIAPTQTRVVREMARCLRQLAEGRTPQ